MLDIPCSSTFVKQRGWYASSQERFDRIQRCLQRCLHGACPAGSMAALLQQLDNFYLTAEQLQDSPSRRVDVDAETEKRLRVYGCDRIQRAVVLLNLPQVVAASAQILLHRFYCKEDLRRWHVRVRACACHLAACVLSTVQYILPMHKLLALSRARATTAGCQGSLQCQFTCLL